MLKRLVICCDGTWNTPDQRENGRLCQTNVAKVALAVAERDAKGVEQRAYYHRGVGTGYLDHVRGGALGWGLSNNIKDAYRFLIANYDPGDELFFFGFSRGAYTVRSTVGLIRNSGLLRREFADKLEAAYELYRRRDNASHPNAMESQLFRKTFAHEPRIKFLGVWDTVGALGIPKIGLGILNLIFRHRWSFHDVQLSRSVDHAYQALAIDEQRKPFKPAIWEQHDEAKGQVLEQVWFAGVHSNVGGGYGDTGLSDIALGWMVEKAKGCELTFDEQLLKDLRPNPLGELTDSMKWNYRILGPYIRPIGEATNSQESAASSAVDRQISLGKGYDPDNLRKYLETGGNTTPVSYEPETTEQRLVG